MIWLHSENFQKTEEQGILPISCYETDYLTTQTQQSKAQIPHEHGCKAQS